MDWLGFMTGVITPLLVCIIGGIITVKDRRRRARDDRADALHIAEINAIMASCRANLVLLHQAHGDKLNGNVDEAIVSVNKALDGMNNVVNGIAGGR